MKILEYRESYSKQELKKLLPKGLIILGIIVIISLIFLISPVIPVFKQYIWIIVFIVLLAFFILKPAINKLFRNIGFLRYGKQGEDEVKNILQETLDDNYTYIPNYIIPNTRIGDIDGLLISPKGILVLEIKNYAGIFRISGSDLYRKRSRDIFQLYYRNPFTQIKRQRDYLEKFLKEGGIDMRVMAIVVLVVGKIDTITGETGVFITEARNLTNHIFELKPIQFSPDLSDKIITALGLKKELKQG